MLYIMTHYFQGNISRVALNKDLYLVCSYFSCVSMTWSLQHIWCFNSYMFISWKLPGELYTPINTAFGNGGLTNFPSTLRDHCIIFMKSRQMVHLENQLCIDNNKIEMKTHTNLLRILVYQHLAFEKSSKGKCQEALEYCTMIKIGYSEIATRYIL